MSFARQLEPELLDDLTPDDPRAIHSRRDLQRINFLMGSAGAIERLMRRHAAGNAPRRIIEFGAGDGSLMLRIARRLAQRSEPAWRQVELTLLDKQPAIEAATLEAFRQLGWNAEVIAMDVMDWAADNQDRRWAIGIANLFMHHFEQADIARLLQAMANRTDSFIACEPRRSSIALAGSKMVGAIGANSVTRTDAVLSVKAGFCGKELSALWPEDAPAWMLEEKPVGLFSHGFYAGRAIQAGRPEDLR